MIVSGHVNIEQSCTLLWATTAWEKFFPALAKTLEKSPMLTRVMTIWNKVSPIKISEENNLQWNHLLSPILPTPTTRNAWGPTLPVLVSASKDKPFFVDGSLKWNDWEKRRALSDLDIVLGKSTLHSGCSAGAELNSTATLDRHRAGFNVSLGDGLGPTWLLTECLCAAIDDGLFPGSSFL